MSLCELLVTGTLAGILTVFLAEHTRSWQAHTTMADHLRSAQVLAANYRQFECDSLPAGPVSIADVAAELGSSTVLAEISRWQVSYTPQATTLIFTSPDPKARNALKALGGIQDELNAEQVNVGLKTPRHKKFQLARWTKAVERGRVNVCEQVST